MAKSTEQKRERKLYLLKLAFPLIIAIVALLIYNFSSSASYQALAQEIRNEMFAEPNVNALLITYRYNDGLMELTVNAGGLTGELASYRAEALAYLCTSPLLAKALEQSETIELSLTAGERKFDKYLLIQANKQICQGMM
ncbi:hypothetical protein ACFO4O_15770 [Glaciecola siphonariae]|uniref:Uncharacterized protein n=1 Tax=Glaciecola siphonariae TaxID=521012 RepID=A0ABV9M1P0_9ALTE